MDRLFSLLFKSISFSYVGFPFSLFHPYHLTNHFYLFATCVHFLKPILHIIHFLFSSIISTFCISGFRFYNFILLLSFSWLPAHFLHCHCFIFSLISCFSNYTVCFFENIEAFVRNFLLFSGDFLWKVHFSFFFSFVCVIFFL